MVHHQYLWLLLIRYLLSLYYQIQVDYLLQSPNRQLLLNLSHPTEHLLIYNP